MTTGRQEWKETGEELGGAFKKLAKNLIRTGAEGARKAEEWAEQDDEEQGNAEKNDSAQGSNVFNDGSWRDTGKSLGKALAGLGSTIMGSVERGAGKAEEWAGDAKESMDSTVEKAARKAEEKVDSLKKDAEEFAEGLREADRENDSSNEPVCDAEVISEEIIE